LAIVSSPAAGPVSASAFFAVEEQQAGINFNATAIVNLGIEF